jgi:SAM-dependent methyltransferase
VLDNSPAQLNQDRLLAQREGLVMRLVEGDMADLSSFADASFDLIFHPVSNVFVPNVLPVWREAYRVLRPGGALLAGFDNPIQQIFDLTKMEQDRVLQVRYRVPYSDLTSLEPQELERYLAEGIPLEFGHTLEDQIGGQLQAGFLLAGLYEDIDPTSLIGEYLPSYMATRALKPAGK